MITSCIIFYLLMTVSNAFSGVSVKGRLRSVNRNFSRGLKYTDKVSFASSKVALRAVPEAGPCPECSDTNGYWDGSTNFVCIACGHEWPVDSVEVFGITGADGTQVVMDVNGNILESGDTVILTKELGKGLKQGLKVARIRVGDFGDDHNVQAAIPGLGTFNLKSQFLKKTK